MKINGSSRRYFATESWTINSPAFDFYFLPSSSHNSELNEHSRPLTLYFLATLSTRFVVVMLIKVRSAC